VFGFSRVILGLLRFSAFLFSSCVDRRKIWHSRKKHSVQFSTFFTVKKLPAAKKREQKLEENVFSPRKKNFNIYFLIFDVFSESVVKKNL
jgi:hypothetical protein